MDNSKDGSKNVLIMTFSNFTVAVETSNEQAKTAIGSTELYMTCLKCCLNHKNAIGLHI